MKTLFFAAKSDVDLTEVLKKVTVRGRMGLCTTVQHAHMLQDVQKQIPGSVLGGQVLGCDVSAALRIKDQVDAFLFIGSGDFHPLEIARRTQKPVYIADPYKNTVTKLPEEEIRFPEDAQWQIQEAVRQYHARFGRPPRGMWPSEGSISDEALELMIKKGID